MLGLEIAGGVMLLVGSVLVIVFTLVGRAIRRRVAEQLAVLEREGIERDSGFVGGTDRYRGFRAPGYYASVAIGMTRRRLVLTARQLAILGGKAQFHVPRAELARYHVGVLDGGLQIVTDEPHGATGHIDMRLAVGDPEPWAAALRAAGCRAAA